MYKCVGREIYKQAEFFTSPVYLLNNIFFLIINQPLGLTTCEMQLVKARTDTRMKNFHNSVYSPIILLCILNKHNRKILKL